MDDDENAGPFVTIPVVMLAAGPSAVVLTSAVDVRWRGGHRRASPGEPLSLPEWMAGTLITAGLARRPGPLPGLT